ncbi:C39 family peptidase [Methylobacterium sp. WCS2018Hpa-22]|uniref:C39 family peptidase n=1 Tax=Methylobacterium sp. WCS2018Hpa-22 TaxID=3073633 RepID=UPI00288C502F|nr:C39 family peptidase [Methylobacterium sp. WCS2018Hpa-22]
MAAYSCLPTIDEWIDCIPPYSFYFDLVAKHWKTKNSNYIPLHRVCTLARKQGAASFVVETAHGSNGVDEEIDYLDSYHGSGGAAEAVKITFLRKIDHNNDINRVNADAIIGQVVFINYRKPAESDFCKSYVYEAYFHPPEITAESGERKRLLNNYICAESSFNIFARGKKFYIDAAYYCQQNSMTHVCAHACLRMALNTISGSVGPVTGKAINDRESISNPREGLKIGNVASFIENSGVGKPIIQDCTSLTSEQYVSIIASHVQSAHPVLLVFTTGTQPTSQPGAVPEEHVVFVCGYTQNSDEWHPQAIPAYSGPASAPYRQSSLWIDHFVIHDDNFGPYYTLSARALEVDKDVKAHWIIAIAPETSNCNAVGAELAAVIMLKNLLPSLGPLASNPWFDYITSRNDNFVLRPILLTKDEYENHLLTSTAHDGSNISSQDITQFVGLPDYFWMVEFSMPSLHTGNHSKLGEVIVEACTPVDPAKIEDLVLCMRLPGLLINFKTPAGAAWTNFSMVSHIECIDKIGKGHSTW